MVQREFQFRNDGTRIEFFNQSDRVLRAPRVVTSFWGPAWEQDNRLIETGERLNTFFDDWGNEQVTALLEEFLAPYRLGERFLIHGQGVGQLPGPRRPLPEILTDDMIRGELQLLMLEHGQTPAENNLYFIFLPPGIGAMRRGRRSCRHFGAYHDSIIEPHQPPIFYAVVAYPDCRGCTHGLENPFDSLTVTCSHEFFNAITDPVYKLGWFDDAHGEVADVCMGEIDELVVRAPSGEPLRTYLRRRVWTGGPNGGCV